jgi:hypothetical protein
VQRHITDRNARVGILQDLVDRMRKVIEERGAEMADVPGGSSGLLVKTYKGKEAATAVYRFDAALVEQINATCKQVAMKRGLIEDTSITKSLAAHRPVSRHAQKG